jgi:hypothetical protein
MKYIPVLLFAGITAFAQQPANYEDTVALTDAKPVQLKEIVINGKHYTKRNEEVTKPVKHQDDHMLFMSNVSMQYAFLITPEKQDSYLSAITLPLMKSAFEAEGRPGVFTQIEFHTLMKIEFLENNNGKPGNKIDNYEQLAIVSNKENAKETTIQLDREAALPQTGFFVQLTMLGRCNEEGTLTNTADYITTKDKTWNEGKWMNWCQPNFPLTKQPKGTLTFYKNPNFKDESWQTINEPSLHELKKYPDMNIGFGYTIAEYK